MPLILRVGGGSLRTEMLGQFADGVPQPPEWSPGEHSPALVNQRPSAGIIRIARPAAHACMPALRTVPGLAAREQTIRAQVNFTFEVYPHFSAPRELQAHCKRRIPRNQRPEPSPICLNPSPRARPSIPPESPQMGESFNARAMSWGAKSSTGWACRPILMTISNADTGPTPAPTSAPNNVLRTSIALRD